MNPSTSLPSTSRLWRTSRVQILLVTLMGIGFANVLIIPTKISATIVEKSSQEDKTKLTKLTIHDISCKQPITIIIRNNDPSCIFLKIFLETSPIR